VLFGASAASFARLPEDVQAAFRRDTAWVSQGNEETE
jgi:hypothetical protein